VSAVWVGKDELGILGIEGRCGGDACMSGK